MATLEISGVSKSFGATKVLETVDLRLDDGEMLVIVGASGSGKSTLLRMVAGLEQPTTGRIILDGRDITGVDPSQRDIAMVFQNYALYPHMSVFDNMAYALRIRGLSRAEIRRRVEEAAQQLELGALLSRKPRQLSGGQRQRVAMGRAIVREPKLFLFDEPLSNLDAKLRVQMRGEIRRLQQRLHVTSLYVTHDQVEAMTLGDRLLLLHQGRAAQLATPMEVFERPADTYVAAFIGSPAMNFLPAALAQNGTAARLEAGPTLPLPGTVPGPDGRTVTIGIRPEHLELTDPDSAHGLPVTIDLKEPLGSETVIHCRLPSGAPLTLRLAGRAPAGDQLTVQPALAHLHVFDAASGQRLEPTSIAVPQAQQHATVASP